MQHEELSNEQVENLFNHLKNTNNYSFNMNKVVEECIEFSEVIVKLQTKRPEKAPNKIEALKEYSDLMIRGMVALSCIFPEKTIDEITDDIGRCGMEKLSKLENWRKEQEYLGGL